MLDKPERDREKGGRMSKISRRDFFQKTTALAAGCALTKSTAALGQPRERPKIKRYKPFGKTGFKVGDISAGSGQREPGLLDYMFEGGINYIDSAAQYGGHEELLAKVLPKWGNKVFVTTKWSPELVTPTVTKAELMKALDESLEKLGTKSVDCMMIHAIGDPGLGNLDRLQNPAIYEAWDEAKKLGKIRFTGASGHSVNLIRDMEWGIDNDRFEIITVGANFITHDIEPVLKKAKAKGIATIAMKTMTVFKSGVNIRGLMDQETNARQAVIKYILSRSDLFDTMIIGMRNFDQVDEYLSVSGYESLDEADEAMLASLEAAIGNIYCRPGCSACYGSCPQNVPIWDVLRYKMYFENYRDEKYAMERYERLPASRTAEACLGCDAPCEKACIHNIPIRARLAEAHNQLRFA
jgi:predicted aldo/keto reductase-like oxidoreductase